MAKWSELNYDLLSLIARHVKVIDDFIAFGAVCTSWRRAAIKDNFDHLSHQLPLLMLAENKDDDFREFYSLSNQKIDRRVSLPEARGRRCFSFHGWLCVTHRSGEVYLLHPFSRTKIQLPYLRQDPPEGEEETSDECVVNIFKAAISANPSLTSEYVIVVSLCMYTDCLAFWRPGDMSWTIIDHTKLGFNKWGGYIDVNFCNGQFYSVTIGAQVWAFDVPGCNTSPQSILVPRLVASLEDNDFSKYHIQISILELSGALLFIKRFAIFEDTDGVPETLKIKTTGFKIFEIDVVTGKRKEIKSLGDRAIFLGISAAISIEVSNLYGIKPNYIYFTDDWYDECSYVEGGGGIDMGAYNLEDGKIESFYPGKSQSYICPPIWVTPSF